MQARKLGLTKKYKHKADRPITGQTAAEDGDGNNEGEDQGEVAGEGREHISRCHNLIYVYVIILYNELSYISQGIIMMCLTATTPTRRRTQDRM